MSDGATPARGKRLGKTTEYMRYDFRQSELLEHARNLGRLNQELATAQERKKAVSADLAAAVKRCEEAVAEETRLVTNGYEYRDIECTVWYHEPRSGVKTIARGDTGEFVKEARMTHDELQEALPFDDQAQPEAAAPIEQPPADPSPVDVFEGIIETAPPAEVAVLTEEPVPELELVGAGVDEEPFF